MAEQMKGFMVRLGIDAENPTHAMYVRFTSKNGVMSIGVGKPDGKGADQWMEIKDVSPAKLYDIATGFTSLSNMVAEEPKVNNITIK